MRKMRVGDAVLEEDDLVPERLNEISILVDDFVRTAENNENERIVVLNWLTEIEKQTPWLIGDILIKWEKNMEKSFLSALKKQINIDDPLPPRTLSEWFNQNPNKLSFGYRTARNYINIRNTTEKKISEKLGTRKTIVINKIEDDETRNKLQQKAIDYNWNTNKVEEEVEKTIVIEGKKDIYKTETPKIKINVTLEKNNVVVHCQNQTHRDIINSHIQKQIESLKQKIIDSA